MKEATNTAPAASEAGDTAKPAAEQTVKINREKYVDTKSASGKKSLHNGDAVATALQGMDVDTLYGVAAKFMEVKRSELVEKYAHLNIGMQRMNLGNRIRGKVNAIDAPEGTEAGTGAKALAALCPAPKVEKDKPATKAAA